MRSPSKQTRPDENEFELIRRISSDDKFAFEILFKRYYADLVRFSFHMTKSIEVSEDIVQDRAVKNQILNYLKHLKFESFLRITEDFENMPDGSNPEIDLYYSEFEKIVREAIQHLPERCRLIFLLHRQNGLTYSEIAQILGLSIKTVEAQMGHALKVLRKILIPYLHLFLFYLL